MTAEDAAELTGFIEARLAEDEAAAKAASDEFGVSGHWYRPEDAGKADLGIAGAQWAHIARHDPARVLREVAAKRKRLALYLDARETLAAALKSAPPEDDRATAHSHVRERINVNQASGRFTALEMSVRLDAATWSDHPAYRDGWKPA